MGRFVNADGQFNNGLLGNNLFAYCENNPVNMADSNGYIPQWIITGVIHLANTCLPGGWAWYYVAKGLISAAGNAFLSYNNYTLSRALFNHGLWGYGRELSAETKELLINKLKSSRRMTDAIDNILTRTKAIRINKISSLAFAEKEADLYYSLQHITFNVKGTKIKGIWNLTVTVWDRYDFNNIRSFSELSFGSAANDLGWAMQRIGMLVAYDILVSYQIKK